MWHTNQHSDAEETKHAISTTVYAPEEIGFIHTRSDAFTYFSGSKAGNRETFGMPISDLMPKINAFSATAEKTCADFSTHLDTRKISDRLKKFSLAVEKMNRSFSCGHSYSDVNEMTEKLLKTGHIPVMLSTINPVAIFECATRSIQTWEVQEYFTRIAGSQDQGRAYLVKHDIMVEIAHLRRDFFQQRQQAAIPDTPLFILYNNLLSQLNALIGENQKTMPAEYEEFDLYPSFVYRVVDIINHFEEGDFRNDLLAFLERYLPPFSGYPYAPQKGEDDAATVWHQRHLSALLYKKIEDYLANKVGIRRQTTEREESIDLTAEQDSKLQMILPLLVYLNSPQNPFAQDGLFGDICSNEFHKEALTAYEAHEKQGSGLDCVYLTCLSDIDGGKKTLHLPAPMPNITISLLPQKVEFTADQMERLLYGSSATESAAQQQAARPSWSSFFSSLLGANTASNSAAANIQSESAQRHRQLALPQPPQCLQLAYNPPVVVAPEPKPAAEEKTSAPSCSKN